jgi:hypothetical protein
MTKDFASSYEQKKWEFAANSHARCVYIINKFPNNPGLSYWENQKAEIEAQYPILKNPIKDQP